ncbi:hypothetical protein ABZ078_26690 [Streptomyces sp. NPDC006385]|uniref:hypothetical protein n=1 Tax=Streptomyces sp. NPDC006385 TaxID=3156761 RepID=UPI0033BB875E
MTSTDTFAEEPDLASLGALLTDRTSAAMCLTLLDGRAWTAADLDRLAGGGAVHREQPPRPAGGLLGEHRAGRQSGPTTYRRRIENCIRAGNTLFP